MKKTVYNFWNVKASGTEDLLEELSLKDFEKIERDRYQREGFIHEAVQFSRWHGKRVLEVGCGSGTDFLQFVRSGANAIGIDLTEKAVQTTQQRLALYGFQAPLVQADAETLPFEEEIFDLVYSWGVLHHTPSIERAVSEIHRVLKPGAVACVMLYHKPAWYHLKMFYVWIKQGDFFRIPFAQYLEQETDRAPIRGANPVARIYSTKEARDLFRLFSKIETKVYFLPYELPILGGPLQSFINLVMRIFNPWIGFFLVIQAYK